MKFGCCIIIQALIYLMSTEEIKLRCPDHSQWNLRFRALCRNSTKWYYCLHDNIIQQYKEKCSDQETFHKPGFKYIISGNLNGEPCCKNRFQPFRFSMDGYSECVFSKSACTEEGQLLHSNGTTKTDITCRCDYTKGFAYVKIPSHTCYCDPTSEDCSCYKKSCGENEVLTADYVCIKQYEWYKDNKCPVILKKRWKDNKTVVTAGIKKSAMPPSSSPDVTRLKVHSQTRLFVTLIGFMLMLSIGVLFITFGEQIVEKCHKYHNIDEIISKRVKEGIHEHKTKEASNDSVQKDEEELRLYKIRDIHNQHINYWGKDDEKYIETEATRQIFENLKTNSFALIVGCTGNGKSSIVRHIALKLKKENQYEVFPIQSPGSIFEFINRERKQIFIIDDFCGEVKTNAQSVYAWISKVEEIVKLIYTSGKNDSKEVANVKFLFVAGVDIYRDYIFKKIKLLMKNVFELSECPLIYEEKVSMMNTYVSPEAVVKLSNELKSDYANFPLLCKIAKGKTADQILNLFSNFKDFIKKDLIALKSRNNLKLCVVTLCALFNNKFKEDILHEVYESDIERRAFEDISSEFNLGPNKDTVRSKIADQLKNLEDMYVAKTENYYHFIHTEVYQIAVVVCSNIFLHSFIRFVRSSFIAESFSFQSNMTVNNKHIIFIENEVSQKRYFDRLMFDLKQGDSYSTFHNCQLRSDPYRTKFVSYCENRKQQVIELLKGFSIKSEMTNEHGICAEKDYEDYTEFQEQHHFSSHKMRKPLIESAWEGYADIVELLLNCDCDINEADKFGRTALFVACLLGKKKIVNVLLESNADFSLCDETGQSPLMVASRERHDDIVNTLLEKHADVNQCDVNGNSPLLVASSMSQLSTVQILSRRMTNISKRNNLGETPIFVASKNGRKDVLGYLLSVFGEYISIPDNEGRSPLFIACMKRHQHVVELLLENGADISQSDWNKRSPLFIASAEGYAEIVTLLIDKKADINQCDEEGMTPLFVACEKGRINTATVLVQREANLNITDCQNRTPLYAACRRGFLDIAKLLHAKEANISVCNKWGGSPLFAACRQGHFDIVKYLVKHDIDVSAQDCNGTTPLLVASENGNTEIGNFLIDNRSNVDQSDHCKKTPLHIAVVGGHYNMAKLLKKRGANTKLTDDDNQTPFDLARKYGFTNIMKLLDSDY